MCEEKANQKEKVSFKTEDLRRFFPKSYTTQDMEKAILQIVEADYRHRQRNRDDGAR
jgi:ParB family chromosome partitioning protein